jgi:hypothetical protein
MALRLYEDAVPSPDDPLGRERRPTFGGQNAPTPISSAAIAPIVLCCTDDPVPTVVAKPAVSGTNGGHSGPPSIPA